MAPHSRIGAGAMAAPPSGLELLACVTRRVLESETIESGLLQACGDIAEAFEIDCVSVWTCDVGGLRWLTGFDRSAANPSSSTVFDHVAPWELEALGAAPSAALADTRGQDGGRNLESLGDAPSAALADARGQDGEGRDYDRARGIAAVLRARCSKGGAPIGCLVLEHRAPRAWTEAESNFALACSDVIASVLDRRRRERGAPIALEPRASQTEKLESLGQLAGGIAHDLNNLLTPMLIGADMLKSALGRDVARADLAESIVSAAIDARELVGQLLAFSRKQVLQLSDLAIADEVRRALTLLNHAMPAAIDVKLDLAPELMVRADPSQLQQILFNLAVNARDAMPAGGVLRIVTRAMELDGTVMVSLRIEDSGAGIDPDSLPHIFEPYFTTKHLGRGTGLGLATVYGIVQQHGGLISVDTAPGRGTCFEIRLPAAAAVLGGDRQDAKAVATCSPPPRGTILVVEDEQAVRRLVVRLLEREHYSVLDAGCPADALELVATYEGVIDLVLTDVVMPGMNGLRLYEEIVAKRPAARVVYMSGYDQDVLAPQGLLTPGVRLLAKPFTSVDLLRHIREALQAISV